MVLSKDDLMKGGLLIFWPWGCKPQGLSFAGRLSPARSRNLVDLESNRCYQNTIRIPAAGKKNDSIIAAGGLARAHNMLSFFTWSADPLEARENEYCSVPFSGNKDFGAGTGPDLCPWPTARVKLAK